MQTVTGGGTHFLFGPDGTLLAEHGVTGAAQRNYVYLNGRPFAVVDGAGAVSYVLTDHLGQPQKMLNAAGAVIWHRVAGVYGDTASQPVGTTAANPIRFPGQHHDATSGLHYNYSRDYDPATGRYLEADPIGMEGGLNLYAYAGANPVNRIDPDGRDIVVISSGPIPTNPFGHVAIAVTGHGVYSKGTSHRPGSDPAAYIASELSRRQVDLTRLRTTPAQDQAAIRAFMRENRKSYDVLSSSCTTAVRKALEAAGFSPSMLRAVLAALTGSVPPDNSPGRGPSRYWPETNRVRLAQATRVEAQCPAMSLLPSSRGEVRVVTRSTQRLLMLVACGALIVAVSAYVRVLMRGELHDKYVYSAIGATMQTVRIPPLQAYESDGGYLLYAVPAHSRGRSSKHDYYEHLQLIALDSMCSDDQICLSDPDKQIDVSCAEVEGALRDPRVLAPVKNFLRSKCRRH